MQIIKHGASAGGRAADADIRRTVESIIDDVGTRGDAAVRDLSTRLDAWSPDSFRLTPGQIADIMSELPPQVLDDIRFAQAQVRGFAQHQRAGLRDIEVETLAGRRARPQEYSSQQRRLLRTRRPLLDGRLSPHEYRHGPCGRSEARHRLHSAVERPPARDMRRVQRVCMRRQDFAISWIREL